MSSTEQQTFPQQKPQRSWFGRNWWWVLILVFVGGFVLCSGICGGFFCLVIQGLRSSEVYQMSLAAVTKDPVVIEKLGEPITDNWFIGGEMNVNNDQGDARLQSSIQGPKGAASVTTVARRIGGKWGLTQIEVTFSDGERHVIQLDADQAGGGMDDAPPWNPPAETTGEDAQ
ncbi:MAG TPA: hypothetical protein DD670_06020 [Planctomycetaceae bacterium]|nr:hypothetical protein [Planctomycetaceae bacterium]